MKDKLKIILISVITIFCIYKIINWVIRPSYAYSSGKSKSDEQLIARAINGEARGESYKGQVAVGAVILNRVNSDIFSNVLDIDSNGYIISNNGKTNVSGIYAAGDVRVKDLRQLVTACSDGAVVASKIINNLSKE